MKKQPKSGIIFSDLSEITLETVAAVMAPKYSADLPELSGDCSTCRYSVYVEPAGMPWKQKGFSVVISVPSDIIPADLSDRGQVDDFIDAYYEVENLDHYDFRSGAQDILDAIREHFS